MKGNGFGVGWEGLYLPSLMKAHAQWRQRSDDLSETLKLFMILGEHLNQQYGGSFYAKAQNLRRALRAAYDEKLKSHDLLLMPTTPMRATPLPGKDSSREEYIKRALEMVPNTCPFDVSGHPAMNIPCGKSEGLPIGLMLVGKHFDEPVIYQAAACFEKNVDWKDMSF